MDRIDNDKGYRPDNIRWATPVEQSNNMRTNRRITHNGRTMTAAQWADEIGVGRTSFYNRISDGWTLEEAIAYKRPPGKWHPRKSFSGPQRDRCFREHKGLCCLCGKKIDPNETWFATRVVPVAFGGVDHYSNRAPAHKACALARTARNKGVLSQAYKQQAVRAMKEQLVES